MLVQTQSHAAIDTAKFRAIASTRFVDYGSAMGRSMPGLRCNSSSGPRNGSNASAVGSDDLRQLVVGDDASLVPKTTRKQKIYPDTTFFVALRFFDDAHH